MIRVGLLGFGLSGSVFHAPLIERSGSFSVRSIMTSRGELARKSCPEAIVVQNIDELLKSDIDLVIVATPNSRHFEDGKACLEAGKHVVIEKPFVVNVNDGEDLIELAAKKKCVLTVFHNRRWDGDFLTVKEIIRSGKLGEVYHFEAHFDRFRPKVDKRWKEESNPGNGNFYDLGSHLIDQALQLFGKPDHAFCDLETQRPGAIATDYFHVLFKYGKKRIILHGGNLVSAPTPRFQVFGTLGSYIKFGLDPQENFLKTGVIQKDPPGLFTDASGKTETISTLPGCYETFYSLLTDAILKGASPPVDPKEALEVIRIIENSPFQ